MSVIKKKHSSHSILIPTKEPPIEPSGPRIAVGPVIGLVTDTTARVLIEVDTEIEVECFLSANGEKKHSSKLRLRKGVPKVFKFFDLSPGTCFKVSFSGVLNSEDRTGSFSTLQKEVSSLTIVSLSCNNVHEPEEPVIWNDLISGYLDPKIANIVLHVGDQVYADSAFFKGVELAKDAREKLGEKKSTSHHHSDLTGDIELKEAIAEEYREVYRQTWNYPPTRKAISCVSNITIWDDHDIRDDWGSHETDSDKTSNEYVVGLAARQVYWEYQRQLWDDAFLEDDSNGLVLAKEITSECNFHKFGSVGIMIVDARGCRSFYRDQTRPFMSCVQWDQITEALSPEGIFGKGDTKVLVVVMSIALCLGGKQISKIASSIMKDKMGFGLHPKEQLDFIKAVHAWKQGGERDLIVIGGDLHIAMRTEIQYQDERVFDQIITSPIRQHPPPGIGKMALKAIMNLQDEVGDGYSFKHVFFKPRRNFCILNIDCPAEGKPNVRSNFFYRSAKQSSSAYSQGELVIKDLKGKDLAAKDSNGLSDPYIKFRILNHPKVKTEIIKKTLNPIWDGEFKIRLQLDNYRTSEKPILKLSVWDWDQGRRDDIIGRATVDIEDFIKQKGISDFSVRYKTVENLQLVSKSDKNAGLISFNLEFRPFA